MKMYKTSLLLITLALGLDSKAQDAGVNDTIPQKVLDSVVFSSYIQFSQPTFLPPTQGMNIYAGKKTNVVDLGSSKANLTQNLARMMFAQIPGLTIWDMDGAGTQINIGSRGTDTHRSIEMNMRQNGYNTNSDMFGYPENHYTPAMQGVERVELVRGSAALQFGSQFGGMMNYVMKSGDTSKAFSLETEQTAGSNDFFNSYNAVSGKKGKVSYYASYNFRHGNGWRKNSAFNYHAYYANVKYDFNSKGSLAFQFSRMDYVQQIAGGLTDEQFNVDARQGLRTRNFFNPAINVPAVLFDYAFSQNTKLQVTAHGLIGQRNSVQFLNAPNIPDTVNTALGTYNPRQVDRDYYNGFTVESRILHHYQMGKMKNTLSGGLRYFIETTKRKQKGVGTTGSDFDLSLVHPYGIDLRLHTNNYAAFAENIFQVNNRFSITPGVRYEVIQSSIDGVVNNRTLQVSYKGNRSFPLFGVGLQYDATRNTQVYGNISQAYRPYIYANVTPADRIDNVDPDLKDTKGYDVDLGYRGKLKDIVSFDVNLFYVFYGNRVGQISEKDENNANFLFTTNIGDAIVKGGEAYVAVSFLKLFDLSDAGHPLYKFQLFNSLSYTHARYQDAVINKGGVNADITGNWVEGVPEWTNKVGLTWQHKSITALVEMNYVSRQFSDANNASFNPTGATGIVPAYHVWDFSATWKFLRSFYLSGGVNNFTNEKYFTRRINMYPGPGILPGDGTTFYLSLGAKL